MIAECSSSHDDACLVAPTMSRPVQCTEEPAYDQQHDQQHSVLVNSQLRKVNSRLRIPGGVEDEKDNSSLSIPSVMDDETWNAQIVHHANQILMALPHLDYKVARPDPKKCLCIVRKRSFSQL